MLGLLPGLSHPCNDTCTIICKAHLQLKGDHLADRLKVTRSHVQGHESAYSSPLYPWFHLPLFQLPVAITCGVKAEDISSEGRQQPNARSRCLRHLPPFIPSHRHLLTPRCSTEGCSTGQRDTLRQRPNSHNFYYGLLQQLFQLIVVIVHLLLGLIYKLNFTGKHTA